MSQGWRKIGKNGHGGDLFYGGSVRPVVVSRNLIVNDETGSYRTPAPIVNPSIHRLHKAQGQQTAEPGIDTWTTA